MSAAVAGCAASYLKADHQIEAAAAGVEVHEGGDATLLRMRRAAGAHVVTALHNAAAAAASSSPRSRIANPTVCSRGSPSQYTSVCSRASLRR
jgi:hypothetical protein